MPVEGRPHGEHGTAAEQARAPDAGRGGGGEGAAGAGTESASRGRRRPCRGGAGRAAGSARPCSAPLPFSSPAAKFACFPGACKNSLLRSVASCPRVPALPRPARVWDLGESDLVPALPRPRFHPRAPILLPRLQAAAPASLLVPFPPFSSTAAIFCSRIAPFLSPSPSCFLHASRSLSSTLPGGSRSPPHRTAVCL